MDLRPRAGRKRAAEARAPSAIGRCLSCRDEQGLHFDLRQAITAALSLDTLLVYAQACHGTSASAKARKAKVAASARLRSVPSGKHVRAFVTPSPVVVFHISARSYSMYTLNDGGCDKECVRQYLIAWGVEALVERLDLEEASALPVRHVGATRFVQQAFSIEDMPAPLATLAALLRRSACKAIGAAVVKLLKAAHAAGTGSGRQRVLTSRREIVRHVQRSPLALCEGRFTNPALLREENVIGQVIDHCIEREYAAADPERREMIYYVP